MLWKFGPILILILAAILNIVTLKSKPSEITLTIEAANIEIVENGPETTKLFNVVYSLRYGGFLLVVPNGWVRIEKVEVREKKLSKGGRGK